MIDAFSLRWRACCALVLALLFLAGCSADRLAREGRDLIADGRYEEGIERLREANRADPRDFSYRTALQERSERSVFATHWWTP